MSKVLLGLALLVVLCEAGTKWHQLDGYSFENYKKEFGKRYQNEEDESFRRNIFNSKLEKIKLHNQDETKSWKEGVNEFTDRTHEEFKVRNGLRKDILYASKDFTTKAPKNSIDVNSLPVNVDWREAGILTAVKDQGDCGSCWTFGTTENVEAYWALATGKLSALSEQQILDCTPNPDDCGGTGGCGGGTPELAMARLISMGGQATEWTYPYMSYFGAAQECQNSTFSAMVELSDYTVLPSNIYEPVLLHIAKVGPLTIAVDASTWSSYESGVYNGCNQTNPEIDHAVQLIGYGTDKQLGEYWLIRNSWNPTWGEDGYIRIARTSTPACGTDLNPSDGLGCKNGPSTVTVCGTCGILFDTAFPVIAA